MHGAGSQGAVQGTVRLAPQFDPYTVGIGSARIARVRLVPKGLCMAYVTESYNVARRAAVLMLGLNVLLCACKLGVGWAGGSFALVADGLNNLTDIGVSAALFLGMLIARRPPDKEHAYGHGKFEQETSRIISVIVAVTGGGIIVSGVRNLADGHGTPAYSVLVVASLAIVLKLYMYRYQNRIATRLSSSALAADALNHKADIAATSCVFVGTAAIWVGGPAWAPADDLAAILVGLLMAVAAGHTLLETSSELLDRMPPPDMVDQIRRLASSFPQIAGVDKILGRRAGLHYLIDIHLEVAGQMTVSEAHMLGHQVKDWLMAEMPQIGDVTVHIEPFPRPAA